MMEAEQFISWLDAEIEEMGKQLQYALEIPNYFSAAERETRLYTLETVRETFLQMINSSDAAGKDE